MDIHQLKQRLDALGDEIGAIGTAMNKDKPELTWDIICKQIGKKRFQPTPRTHFGRLLRFSKPTENSEKENKE